MIKNFSLVLLVVCTLFVVFLKPKLHKTVLFSEPLTKQEQIEEAQVDWNSWHSNILNKILIEVKNAPEQQPNDTLNYIEFDVDSDKNIVNIKIYTEPQQYSQNARNHFSSFIRSLNGDNILAFPANSQRKIAHFNAVLKKAKKTKLSTPSDFSDYETIKVKK